jgi:nitrogen fixation NifU-like protein
MTEDSLYPEEVKVLARAAEGTGRLVDAHGKARLDNPLCGDRVDVDVRLTADGRIEALGHQVRGCLLCQAAASALASAAIGKPAATLTEMRQGVERMLATVAAEIPPSIANFAVFRPVHRAKSRHACVLLPLKAAEAAVAAAMSSHLS